MYGQGRYGRGGNVRRIQTNDQSQGNYNHGDFSNRMGQQQNSDPQQDHINEQPAPQTSQASQESQFSSPCQVIQPNLSKREKLLQMARKEEEDYERYKESRRPGPINLTPMNLGGHMSESEVREQQQRTQALSKYQKMIQRQDYRRKQKEEEEAEIQKMKDIQRKKAEKLKEKSQEEDLARKERWHEDRCRTNNTFLDKFQPTSRPYHRHYVQPNQSGVHQEQEEDLMLQQACKASLLTHNMEEETRLKEIKKPQHKQPKQQTYRQQQKEEEEKRLNEMKDEQRRKAEALKQHEEERTLHQEQEHRRVNNAFLDRLQRQNTSQHKYSGESNTWA